MPRRRNPERRPVDTAELTAVLARQDGVISRRQLDTVGVNDPDVERMVRRRELVWVSRSVYVDQTGPLTARQREWATVLRVPGSALADESALAAATRNKAAAPGQDGLIHLAVPAGRNVTATTGVRVHYVSGLDRHVLWNASPPRMKPEIAAVRVAGRADDDVAAVAVLADAINRRLTTATRMLDALERLPCCRRRRWLRSVLADLGTGACSTLEQGYLERVDRAHGLPASTRQAVRVGADGREYRDVEYDGFGFVVELDGKAFHNSVFARDRDFERDLDDRVAGKDSVRLTWGQVFRHSCRTAGKLAAVLHQRGWTGQPTRCGPRCTLAA